MSGVHLDVDGCARVVAVFDAVTETLHTALRRLDREPIETRPDWWSARHELRSLTTGHETDAQLLERRRRQVVAADGAAWPVGDGVRRQWNDVLAVAGPAMVREAWGAVARADDAIGARLPFGAVRLVADLVARIGSDDAVDHADPADPGGTFDQRPVAPFVGAVPGPSTVRGREAVARLLAATTGSGIGSGPPQAAADEFQLIDHGGNTYTVVLGGVIDLSRPEPGLDPDHRSVRDLDVNAIDTVFSSSPDDEYARAVAEGVRRAGVPPGANLLLVGHSYGAGAALDLAADPVFNGDEFAVTHVVASGYHADPWLSHVAPDTGVLVLENRRDLVVAAESLADRLVVEPPHRHHHALVRSFDGGLAGAGHEQRHYIDFVEQTTDPDVARFLRAIAHGGHARPGATTAIDISVPPADQGRN
ncbi:MAG: hypothetical protein AAFN30_00105 [Actinomycetota bacterium]